MIACREGKKQVVERLLGAGANVDLKDKVGCRLMGQSVYQEEYTIQWETFAI